MVGWLAKKSQKWNTIDLCSNLQQDYMHFTMQMDLMENQENIWSHSWEEPHERHSEALPRDAQSLSRNAELTEARERLLAFMGTLSELRKTEIREDILHHCDQLNKNKKVVSSYISDDTVLRLVTCRIEKMLKNKKLKKNWSEEDIKILVWVASKYCDRQAVAAADLALADWEHIARLIPGVTPSSCMFKWLSIRKTNLSNCNWAAAESQLLRDVISLQQAKVESFTHLNWKAVAEDLYFRNHSPMKVFRSSKQCREHWNCFLNPRLKKGPWLAAEDVQLLTLIRNNNGGKKWSEIVNYFQGRTENALKNRYTLLLDKQKRISKSKQEVALIDDCLQRILDGTHDHPQNILLQPIADLMGDPQHREDDPKEEDIKESCSLADSIEKESENGKSEENTITSMKTPPSDPEKRTVPKIHYLTSKDQFQFLEWMRRRNDIRRCCLKNGSFEMEDC